LNCIHKNIQVPKQLRVKETSFITSRGMSHLPFNRYNHKLKEKKQPKPKQFITCSGYNHIVNFDKTKFCSLCSSFYCKGCLKDSRRHPCAKFFNFRKGIDAALEFQGLYI